MPTLPADYFEAASYKRWSDDHVRFSDLDALGHVNNLSVAQYFENARVGMFTTLVPAWPHIPHIFVLVHQSIDYVHELHYPARVRIGLRLIKIGNTSLQLGGGVFRDNTCVAAGQTVQVLIDTKTRKPEKVTEEMRAMLTKHFA